LGGWSTVAILLATQSLGWVIRLGFVITKSYYFESVVVKK